MISSRTSETASSDAASSGSPRAYGRQLPGNLGAGKSRTEGQPSPADISPDHTYGDVRFAVQRMDVETFNHIKQWQRSLCASTGRKLTNSQVLRVLILSVPPPKDDDVRPST